jgi:hypothetical protein
MCKINVYSEAIKAFGLKNPFEMAANAGADYNKNNNKIIFNYYSSPVKVNYPSGEIEHEPEITLNKNEKILILQYITGACGVIPKENWISFIQLPNGINHQAPFVVEALSPLAEKYGNNFNDFLKCAGSLGAVKITLGDKGVVLPVFPKVPLAVCLWEGDDEFPANANMLFDITAPLHMTTAALWVLGVEVSRKLRRIEGQQYI